MLPLILIPRCGGKYSNTNYINQLEFLVLNGLKTYNRGFWDCHVQSRTTKHGKPPTSHMELGADYCFDMLNSDLMKREGDALANMACFNVGSGNICGSYKGGKVFPFTVYNKYINHVTAWMNCDLVKNFKLNGFEPVFLFHNILIGESKYSPTNYQLVTINSMNTTNIGLMGFIRGRKKDASKRMFVSACINGKIPQLLFI